MAMTLGNLLRIHILVTVSGQACGWGGAAAGQRSE